MLFTRNKIFSALFFSRRISNLSAIICSAFLCFFLSACAIQQKAIQPISAKPTTPQDRTISELPDFLQQELQQQSLKPRRVALLLPLSGNNQALGKSLLDAATLALFEQKRADIFLVPIDTKNNRTDAENAAKQALYSNVEMVIGPVFGQTTQEVAEILTPHIPVVSFSNDFRLTNQNLFLLGISSLSSLEQLLNYAQKQGKANFYALLPDDVFGHTAADILNSNIRAANNGNYSFSAQYYPTKSTDNSLPNLILALQNNLAAAPNKNAQALFFPEGGERLTQAEPYLRALQNNNPNLQIIGSSLWDRENLQNISTLYNAWFNAPEPANLKAFEQRFKEKFGYAPHRLSSLAYDAIALSAHLTALHPQGKITREAFFDQRGFAGTNGIFRFRPDGSNERGLTIMQSRNGNASTLQPATKRFEN
jgi:branched-chain amino acid transport system substrate-binding protein